MLQQRGLPVTVQHLADYAIWISEIGGSHSAIDEGLSLLGCYAVSTGK
jgi:hypothetical protein